MGLDIAFNKQQALAAGIQLSTCRNGDDDDIARASQPDEDDFVDGSYLYWLQQDSVILAVPNTEHCVGYCEGTDSDGEPVLIVRANHWGSTYGPLTAWLKQHEITWSEF